MSAFRSRPGFALFFALVAVVLISALASATLFRVLEFNTIARLNTLQLHASSAADRALRDALNDQSIALLSIAPVGSATTVSATFGDEVTTVTATKLDSTLVWIVAAASIRRGRLNAVRRTAVSALFNGVSPPIPLPGPAWVDLH